MFKTSLYNVYMHIKHIHFFFTTGHFHKKFRRLPFFLLKFPKTPPFWGQNFKMLKLP